MLDIQKKLTRLFFVLLTLPATAMGFALSAAAWLLVKEDEGGDGGLMPPGGGGH